MKLIDELTNLSWRLGNGPAVREMVKAVKEHVVEELEIHCENKSYFNVYTNDEKYMDFIKSTLLDKAWEQVIKPKLLKQVEFKLTNADDYMKNLKVIKCDFNIILVKGKNKGEESNGI